jgi:hypothetical protein
LKRNHIARYAATRIARAEAIALSALAPAPAPALARIQPQEVIKISS